MSFSSPASRGRELSSSPATRHPRRHAARGLTLTEVLIAVTVTLVLLAILVNAFRDISDEISRNRAVLEMAGQLRNAATTIEEDTRLITANGTPWIDPGAGMGYFEVVEHMPGDFRQGFYADAATNTPVPTLSPVYPNTVNIAAGEVDTILGDVNDIVMFTARSPNRPFRGRLEFEEVPGAWVSRTVESEYAEIIYWTTFVDINGNGLIERDLQETVQLHRRVFLILPELNLLPLNGGGMGVPTPHFIQGDPAGSLARFYQNNDVSVHLDALGRGLVANSLEDLSKRENRIVHSITTPSVLPFFVAGANRTTLNNLLTLQGDYQGGDILLSDLVAFDVRCFDPNAPLLSGAGGYALTPGDPGYFEALAAGATPIGLGAFVDLGYGIAPGLAPNYSRLSSQPHLLSRMGNFVPPNSIAGNNPILLAWDTWPNHYETNGLDEDGLFGADQAHNGYDDNNLNGPDDATERETRPPYEIPLQGIEVSIRVIETGTQQLRQSSVVVDLTE